MIAFIVVDRAAVSTAVIGETIKFITNTTILRINDVTSNWGSAIIGDFIDVVTDVLEDGSEGNVLGDGTVLDVGIGDCVVIGLEASLYATPSQIGRASCRERV